MQKQDIRGGATVHRTGFAGHPGIAENVLKVVVGKQDVVIVVVNKIQELCGVE